MNYEIQTAASRCLLHAVRHVTSPVVSFQLKRREINIAQGGHTHAHAYGHRFFSRGLCYMLLKLHLLTNTVYSNTVAVIYAISFSQVQRLFLTTTHSAA